MVRRGGWEILFLVFGVTLAIPAGAGEAILTLPTSRAGETQAMLVIDPPGPVSDAVLLMVGGGGQAGLASHPAGWRSSNFLFRTADLFVARGMLAAVLDAPSDHPVLWNFRSTSDHVADMAIAAATLRGRGAVRVWVVGTSMGTVSAAAAGRAASVGADGIVLTSPVTQPGRQTTETVLSVALDEIAVPVLVVRHDGDDCKASPPWGADRIMDRLERAPFKSLLGFSGGLPPESAPCEPLAAHGYFGIEAEVVTAIVDWISARH